LLPNLFASESGGNRMLDRRHVQEIATPCMPRHVNY
jgi:hypothetical protein